MKKVVIIGPESTGKTTLTQALANHFDAPLVQEYARTYIQKLNRPYLEEDLLTIAEGQAALEDVGLSQNPPWLFCDTDLRVIKIWSLFKYGKVHDWITNQINERNCDLYLLCAIDLPWEQDPQREDPQQRQVLFSWYEKELEESQSPYQIIRGSVSQRMQAAINALSSLPK